MAEQSYYTHEGAPLRCDCEPPQVAVIEYDVETWIGRLPKDVREAVTQYTLAHEEYEVTYVAHCPDYPGGCKWIEANLAAVARDG